MDDADRIGDTGDAGAGDAAGANARSVVAAHAELLDGVPPLSEAPESLHDPVADLLGLLTNAYALPVLYRLFCAERPLRFSELEATTGASPKVLSRRLAEFDGAGLVARRSYDEVPPRVEYEPTAAAAELAPAFQFLYAWATRHRSE